MPSITRFCFDPAESHFAVCGVDAHGKIVIKETLTAGECSA